jgi:transposase-like protein
MARGERDRTKERYWRRHVAEWRRSDQSVRAYCKSAGVSEPSFYAWRRVLAERESLDGAGASQAGGRGASDQAAATRPGGRVATAISPFVPVRLVEDPTSTAAVEVVLRGGRVVRVAAGFAAKTLREVVTALEDLPC